MDELVTDGRGWYKTYRQLDEWEWFQDSHMVHLFIYLIGKARHNEGKWQGITINPGELVTSIGNLSKATGISFQSIRTCLGRLESTGEITRKSTHRLTKISICNYSKYQNPEESTNILLTSCQHPANNKQELKNYRIKEKNKESEFILPEKIDPPLWEAFEEMRKSIKAPLTDHAKKLILDKLMRFDDPNGSLRQSIENTWRGVFPLKEQIKKENSEFI
jgi:hypothetical protein